MPEIKTKLMQDAERAEAYLKRLDKKMESAREENAKIREAKDKASSKKMESAREENAKIREAKDKASSKKMESAREENAKRLGYKKGGLIRQGKPKLAKKGWR
jgi:hypothetical protein